MNKTLIGNIKNLVEDAVNLHISSNVSTYKSTIPGPEGQKGDKGDTGISVSHIKGTNTTDHEGDFGTMGEKDTYTLYGDYNESIVLGYFTVSNGKSAYQYAIDSGFNGTDAEFSGILSSLNTVIEQITEAKEAAIQAASEATEAKNIVTPLIPEIEANTASRHSHSNKNLLDSINQELNTGSDVEFSSVNGIYEIVGTTNSQTITNKVIDSITNKIGADHIHYKVKAGESLVKGNIVKVTGYIKGEEAVVVSKVSSNSDVAVGIVENDIVSGSYGLVVNTGIVENINTSIWSFGTILYSNGSGGLSSSKPTNGMYQACALVLRSNTYNGSLLVEFTEPKFIASTTQSGYVRLNDTLTSTNTTEALTAAKGKALYDSIVVLQNKYVDEEW